MNDCKCCEGTCVECKEIPNQTCCTPAVMDGEWRCVIPQPENPSMAMPSGARYDCDIFDICPIPAGTLTAEAVTAIERSFHSVLQYFPAYATNSYMGCPCYTHIFHGRDATCYERNISPVMFEADACPAPTALEPKECGCGSGGGLLKYWTPTLPSNCCPRTETMVVTDPDTGEDTETTVTVYPKQMFGSVPASHPHWTKYGGQGTKGLDMDMVQPAYLEKVVALFCKFLKVIQAGGPPMTMVEG